MNLKLLYIALYKNYEIFFIHSLLSLVQLMRLESQFLSDRVLYELIRVYHFLLAHRQM